MHPNPRRIFPVIGLILLALAAVWFYTRQVQAAVSTDLSASGTIEAVEVSIGAEMGGLVSQVMVSEGDRVQPGDVLFQIDDALLQTQIVQAQAGVGAAQAGKTAAEQAVVQAQASRELAAAQLAAAQAGLELARLQSARTLNQALQADLPLRTTSWRDSVPSQFNLPTWYYGQAEQLSAAQVEVDEAARILEIEKVNYDQVISGLDSTDFLDVEKRLVDAQAAFLVAQAVLDRSRSAQLGTELVEYAQELFDSAESALKSAQDDYDQVLSDEQSQQILEARARWVVAQERYETAEDQLRTIQTGRDALEVQIAQASVNQAEVAVTQAQAALTQAEAALPQAKARAEQAAASLEQAQAASDTLHVQLDKLTVRAPAAGVVMARNIEPGELVQPGSVALVLGNLDELTITVYLPEDRYGEVQLGDAATVSVDSYAGKDFAGQVTHIADKAEFTPRNVQTAEGRRTTVFAIRVALDVSNGKLKPGMPADVIFGR